MHPDLHPDSVEGCNIDASYHGRVSLSVVLTYLPYEVPESQELRVAAYDIYAQVVGEAQKRGPVLGLGDHTTSVRCTILN